MENSSSASSGDTLTIRATVETLPYGAVSDTDGTRWAVVHVERLKLVGTDRYATLDEALSAAADRRRRDVVEDRANRNFDEEMDVLGDD